MRACDHTLPRFSRTSFGEAFSLVSRGERGGSEEEPLTEEEPLPGVVVGVAAKQKEEARSLEEPV